MIRTIFVFISTVLLISCDSKDNTSDNNILDQELTIKYIEELANRNVQINQKILNILNDDSLINDAHSFINLTNTAIKDLQDITEELIQNCGGRNEYFELIEPYNSNCVMEYLISNKSGNNIKDLLADIENNLTAREIDVNKIALDAQQIDVFKNIPEFKSKQFHEYNFDQANLIEALVRLKLFELYITSYQNRYLIELLTLDQKS